jgi:hypothetical protein
MGNFDWALNREQIDAFLTSLFNESTRVEPPFQALAQRIGSLIEAFGKVEGKQAKMVEAVRAPPLASIL